MMTMKPTLAATSQTFPKPNEVTSTTSGEISSSGSNALFSGLFSAQMTTVTSPTPADNMQQQPRLAQPQTGLVPVDGKPQREAVNGNSLPLAVNGDRVSDGSTVDTHGTAGLWPDTGGLPVLPPGARPVGNDATTGQSEPLASLGQGMDQDIEQGIDTANTLAETQIVVATDGSQVMAMLSDGQAGQGGYPLSPALPASEPLDTSLSGEPLQVQDSSFYAKAAATSDVPIKDVTEGVKETVEARVETRAETGAEGREEGTVPLGVENISVPGLSQITLTSPSVTESGEADSGPATTDMGTEKVPLGGNERHAPTVNPVTASAGPVSGVIAGPDKGELGRTVPDAVSATGPAQNGQVGAPKPRVSEIVDNTGVVAQAMKNSEDDAGRPSKAVVINATASASTPRDLLQGERPLAESNPAQGISGAQEKWTQPRQGMNSGSRPSPQMASQERASLPELNTAEEQINAQEGRGQPQIMQLPGMTGEVASAAAAMLPRQSEPTAQGGGRQTVEGTQASRETLQTLDGARIVAAQNSVVVQKTLSPALNTAVLPDSAPATDNLSQDTARAWQNTFEASLEAGNRLFETASSTPDTLSLSPATLSPTTLIHSVSSNTPQSALTGLNPTVDLSAANQRLETPLGQRDWDQALGQRMLLMVDNKQQTAELKLNPRHLGSIDIRLNLNNDQANLSIHTQHTVVRDALESALPRLREMFDQAGLNLEQVNVSNQGSGMGSQQGHLGDGQAAGHLSESAEVAETESEEQSTAQAMHQLISPTLLDAYV